ncbi:hypothetical protein KR054_009354 [Drosophila jambulina]|nr:hypothetical protein KR054_009354 [Drosophila jambulina]
MSNPQDVALPIPEGPPLADTNQGNHRKPKMVKRFFKKISITRLFARKKRSTDMDGIPVKQGPSAANEPEEMLEMDVLPSHRTIQSGLAAPLPSLIQEPEPQTVS